MFMEDTPFNPMVTDPQIVDNLDSVDLEAMPGLANLAQRYETDMRFEISGDFRRYLDVEDNDEVMPTILPGITDEEFTAIHDDAIIDPEMLCFYIYASRRETLEPVLRELRNNQA